MAVHNVCPSNSNDLLATRSDVVFLFATVAFTVRGNTLASRTQMHTQTRSTMPSKALWSLQDAVQLRSTMVVPKEIQHAS